MDGPHYRPLLALLIRLGAIAALATMSALIKLAAERGIHLLEIMFWRQFLTIPIALGWVINLFQRGAASMGRINRIFEEHPAISDPAEPHALPPARGGREVTFEHVWFKYPSAGDRGWVLEDVSFDAPFATEVERAGTGPAPTHVVSIDEEYVNSRLAELFKEDVGSGH